MTVENRGEQEYVVLLSMDEVSPTFSDLRLVVPKDVEGNHVIAVYCRRTSLPTLCRVTVDLTDLEENLDSAMGVVSVDDSEPTLQRSIRLRNPYVDPIHLTQVDLLRRWRAADRDDPDLFAALLVSVNGISQGLQGSG